jgi:hypothetical protein
MNGMNRESTKIKEAQLNEQLLRTQGRQLVQQVTLQQLASLDKYKKPTWK